MSDPSNPPRLDEPHTGVMPSAALNDWNQADIEMPPPEPAVAREPIFSRRVLVGWALFALVAYFGVHLIGSVIKSSVREAINTAGEMGGNPPGKEIIYRTPNGKITITRDEAGGPIRVIRTNPTRSRRGGPTPAEQAADAAEIAAEAAAEAAAVAAATTGTALPKPLPAKAPPAPAPVKR